MHLYAVTISARATLVLAKSQAKGNQLMSKAGRQALWELTRAPPADALNFRSRCCQRRRFCRLARRARCGLAVMLSAGLTALGMTVRTPTFLRRIDTSSSGPRGEEGQGSL